MSASRLPDSVQSLPEALAFWAEHTPHAAAIVVPGSPVMTYAELWGRVRAVAQSLVGAGVRREDRVVLLVPDGVAMVESLLGTMLAGVAAPLPASLTAPELDEALDGLRAAAALVTPGIDPAVLACFARHAVSTMELGSATLQRRNGMLSWPEAADLAIVRHTSGTTGRPKRTPCQHGSLVAHGRRNRDELGLHPHDRTALVSPVSMTLGQAVLAHALTAGASIVMQPLAGDFAAAWAAIARGRPTWLSTSAGFLEVLASTIETQPALPCPPSLRFVQVTSAPIAAETCRALEERLGVPILPRYSSTEAGGIAMTWPPPARRKPGSVGQPVQEVRIVAADGADVQPGREGEIWVRGPGVMSGYLDDPEATAAVLRPDGWYRTGDLGYLDEDRFLFLTGRLNELINRGGEKIAPAEVDAVLQAHPAIVEAATFAAPDARLGEDLVAAVVLREGVSIPLWQLRAWLLERLSPVKTPRRFWVLDSLPRTPTGKVQRRVLAATFLAERDRPQAPGARG